MHSRSCTQPSPDKRHSSQPAGVRGATGRMAIWWVQTGPVPLIDDRDRKFRSTLIVEPGLKARPAICPI